MSAMVKNSDPNYFNYDVTKLVFDQELGYVLFQNHLLQKVVRDKEGIKKIIEEIQQNETTKTWNRKYVVSCENGEDILCKVVPNTSQKANSPSNIVQVLSIDECFDILAELYLCEPKLDAKAILRKCSTCYIIPNFIRVFWKACGKINKIKDVSFKTVGEIDFISLSSPDNQFTDILVYIERHTNFILLRPLRTKSIEEVGLELLNIFCDFGPPKFVDYRYKIYFQKVWDLLLPLDLPMNLPQTYSFCRTHKIPVMMPKVTKMIEEWMKTSVSQNWAIGLHIIQWILNKSPVCDTYVRSKTVQGPIKCAYHALFGVLPHDRLMDIDIDTEKKPINEPMKKVAKIGIDCSQCNQPIYKVYKCQYCKASCHFFCCERIVLNQFTAPKIINKCISCVNKGICVDEEIIIS